ncbi:MAG: ASKHA domain-containing protein [Acutalibacteraceae bacterium]
MENITVTVKEGNNTATVFCKKGDILLDVLRKSGFFVSAECGGLKKCKKCLVNADGKDVLSCEYEVNSDITVILHTTQKTEHNKNLLKSGTVNVALDIGTTTVNMCFLDDKNHKIQECCFLNPQKSFGADVISRLSYIEENGIANIRNILVKRLNDEIEAFKNQHNCKINKMVVVGNTTMLHIFYGADTSTLGKFPYKSNLLNSVKVTGKSIGISCVEEVVSPPSASAFFGADAISGVEYLNTQSIDNFLLMDLGTNAEIALVNGNEIYCTSAPAGPCFEGAEITCGVGAVSGAISHFKIENGENITETVNAEAPIGICGTGLIDIIAELLKNYIINKNGDFCEDIDEFEVTNNIYLSGSDIRTFQKAKSAIYSATDILFSKSNLSYSDISAVFISGGFSEYVNEDNLIKSGLLPENFKGKIKSGKNTALLGAEMYLKSGDFNISNSYHYVDLNQENEFNKSFIDNMTF